MLFQPSLCVFEGEEGILLLAPVRRSCCLELLCYQDDSALSKLGRVSLNTVKCPLDFFPSIPQDDGTAMRTTGRVLGFREFAQQPLHARGIERSVYLNGRVARDRGGDPGARRF